MTGIFGILESIQLRNDIKMSPNSRVFIFSSSHLQSMVPALVEITLILDALLR
jgi:hypothetical protein